jgi:hypothetical protein
MSNRISELSDANENSCNISYSVNLRDLDACLLDHMQNQLKLVHILTKQFSQIHFNIILPSTPDNERRGGMITLVLGLLKIPGSNLGHETWYPDNFFVVLLRS